MENDSKTFYKKHLDQHGASAQGVGWKNREAQYIRFEQLAKLFRRSNFTLNDLGCGVGDFVEFARERSIKCIYRGYDQIEDMIAAAVARYGKLDDVRFQLVRHAVEMDTAEYSIASGIFNIRFDNDEDSWQRYILETLTLLDAKSSDGFAFNILTKYSDPEFMKKELYYADPCFIFDFCKKKFSKNVALLHDYNQYDFTIIVRKDL